MSRYFLVAIISETHLPLDAGLEAEVEQLKAVLKELHSKKGIPSPSLHLGNNYPFLVSNRKRKVADSVDAQNASA